MPKDKIIIIAAHHTHIAQSINSLLQADGFSDIRVVDTHEKIFQILRACYDQPERLGLIIVDETLPNLLLNTLISSLSDVETNVVIPLIVLGLAPVNDHFQNNFDCENGLIYRSSVIFNPNELVLAVNFLLIVKQERIIRHQQQDRHIAELADKNVLDARLKFLAAHDELTGLFNRSHFERLLRLVFTRNNRMMRTGALFCIDIDRFSLINELEGFESGDMFLVELTLLIRQIIPTDSIFSRTGPDELYLYIENQTQPQAHQIAETIRSRVESYRFIKSNTVYSTTVSIGITVISNNVVFNHPNELCLHSRQACNLAKEQGRNRIRFYVRDDISVKERERDICMVPIIRNALRQNRFFLMFQPVVELDTGDVSHYEVLIRMRGEHDEIIGPDRFIPAAERVGLIHNIDLWVVENAIDFLASLPAHRSYVSVAINLSGVAFQDPDLLPAIRDKLELTWVDASRLKFEITETAAVDNFEKTREMINKIRQLGCKFALDDFGAGFCSFNYLKAFPVEYVKIDGQFIRHLLNDPTDQILVKAMVEIASKLGKKVIAEFVENLETARMLSDIGVHYGQGYLFGKPNIKILDGRTIEAMKGGQVHCFDQDTLNLAINSCKL